MPGQADDQGQCTPCYESTSGEAFQIGEHGPYTILSIEPQQGTLLLVLMHSQIATNGAETLTQFFPVVTVSPVAIRRASTDTCVNAAKKRESAEREGSWSRSNKAMKGTAKGCRLS